MIWTARLYDGDPDDGGEPLTDPVPSDASFEGFSSDSVGFFLNQDLYVDHVKGAKFLVLLKDGEPFYSWEIPANAEPGMTIRVNSGIMKVGTVLPNIFGHS